MTNHAPDSAHSPARLLVRALALTPLLTMLFAGVLFQAPAWASAPESWPSQPKVSLLHAVLLLGGCAAGLFVLITLLVLLPGMVRHDSYQPGRSWRSGPEWFGGPRGGLESLDAEGQRAIGSHSDADEGVDRGGASARW